MNAEVATAKDGSNQIVNQEGFINSLREVSRAYRKVKRALRSVKKSRKLLRDDKITGEVADKALSDAQELIVGLLVNVVLPSSRYLNCSADAEGDVRKAAEIVNSALEAIVRKPEKVKETDEDEDEDEGEDEESKPKLKAKIKLPKEMMRKLGSAKAAVTKKVQAKAQRNAQILSERKKLAVKLGSKLMVGNLPPELQNQ